MVDENDMVMSLEAQKTRVASSNDVNLTKTAHQRKWPWPLFEFQMGYNGVPKAGKR